MDPLVLVIGPTASGKTALAVSLALARDGEVISADSTQVYRGLDIGTEKATLEERRGIPHHLLDVADPSDRFTAAEYVELADKAIARIRAQEKVPIVAGGTGFYLTALLYGLPAEVGADEAFRAEAAERETDALLEDLARRDPRRAAEVAPEKNRRRIIRALEIARALGTVPERPATPRYEATVFRIRIPRDVVRQRIVDRLARQESTGLLSEVARLREAGLSDTRLAELGYEYALTRALLDGELTRDAWKARLVAALTQYAKRQETYFDRYFPRAIPLPYDNPLPIALATLTAGS